MLQSSGMRKEVQAFLQVVWNDTGPSLTAPATTVISLVLAFAGLTPLFLAPIILVSCLLLAFYRAWRRLYKPPPEIELPPGVDRPQKKSAPRWLIYLLPAVATFGIYFAWQGWLAMRTQPDLVVTKLATGPGPSLRKVENVWYVYYAIPGQPREKIQAPFYVRVENRSDKPVRIEGWQAQQTGPFNEHVNLFKIQDRYRVGDVYIGATCHRLFEQHGNDFEANTRQAIPPGTAVEGWLLFAQPYKNLDLNKVRVTVFWGLSRSLTVSPLDVTDSSIPRYPIVRDKPRDLCGVPPLKE
jgi:hypothetical protein